MATVPTQGNMILVDPPEMGKDQGIAASSADLALAGYVTGKVDPWEDHRNMGYAQRWKEYWRLWRGQWHSDDKNRASERSRLIAPALSQAIEASAAEVEEILLGKEMWFDLPEDPFDETPQDTQTSIKSLRYDFEKTKTKMVAKEAILNASIFGTGILKLNVQVVKDAKPTRKPGGKLERTEEETVFVQPESVRPDEFIPDPAGVTIEEMAGCAVRLVKPMHYIIEKIESGEYRRSALSQLAPTSKMRSGYEVDHGVDVAATLSVAEAEPLTITEYHGKVPAALLDAVLDSAQDNPLDTLLAGPVTADGPLVEAIVVVANDNVLLKAMVNPFTMKDRGIIAFPWEKVPGRFWGRGVGEKGWNPQKGLDSELRSRQDSLGFISAPMVGIDSGRMPRGFKYEVRPGKIWPTNGPPREIIQPIEMGALQQATFGQTQEMERMVQMGTGAFDTAASLKGGQTQSGANGAGSNSLMMGAFVKRAKRAAMTIEKCLIEPLIRKSLWRYMQFSPTRYPADFEFRVVGNMGIMAREVESMQMTQLLGMMPQEIAPNVQMAVTKGVIEMSSVTNKLEIQAAIDEAMKPPSPEEQAEQAEMQALQKEAQKAQLQGFMLDNQKTIAETKKLLSEELVKLREADQADEKVKQETARVMIQIAELDEARAANALDARRLDIEERRVELDARKVNSTK